MAHLFAKCKIFALFYLIFVGVILEFCAPKKWFPYGNGAVNNFECSLHLR